MVWRVKKLYKTSRKHSANTKLEGRESLACFFFGSFLIVVTLQIKYIASLTNKDICSVSKAIGRHPPLNVLSYYGIDPVLFPNERVPHLSTVLCELQKKTRSELAGSAFPPHSMAKSNKQAIFAFKAARTGSTFFTDVIVNTLKETGRPTSFTWEPYGTLDCNGPSISSNTQQKALRDLLTKRCTFRGDRCNPNKNKNKVSSNESGAPIFMTAANPRFFNLKDLDWNNVFQGLASPRIFSLRRTNLILMAYSKFHHDGCAVEKKHSNMFQVGKQDIPFTFEIMMICIEHYAFADQEISSSVAFQATTATDRSSRPFLVVYEDVLANSILMKEEIVRYLGYDDLNLDGVDIFTSKSKMNKEHTGNFCDYKDLDCSSLSIRLQNDYPCLYQQLAKADENLVWSVPILRDGMISIQGNCHPLEHLSNERRIRTFEELYTY